MIYQRAGIQEARYQRGQGLTDWNFVRISLPPGAPSFSAPSRVSGRSSKKPSKIAFSRTSVDDGSEEEDPVPSRANGRSSKKSKKEQAFTKGPAGGARYYVSRNATIAFIGYFGFEEVV